MNPLHKKLSSAVKNQIPAFYHQYGPGFVSFIEQFYKWMEEEGQLTYITRRLPELKNVQTTDNELLYHFKEKYLSGVELTDPEGIRNLIKNTKDLYDTKGSKRSFELLFKLLYNDNISISYPFDEVLKPSDGVWYKPEFIELVQSEKARQLVGKQVVGSTTDSKAFIESVVRINVGGKNFDVAFISKPVGLFRAGEQIGVEGGSSQGAPIVKGSLTSIDITDGGKNNNVGDLFYITSPSGVNGLARVAETVDATGRVDFEIIDRGWGYTSTPEIAVSNIVLAANNVGNTTVNFLQFETVEQDLANIVFIGNMQSISNNAFIKGYDVGGLNVGNGFIVETTALNATHTIAKVQVTGGSFATVTDIGTTTPTPNAQTRTVTISQNVMAIANIIGFTANSVGIFNPVGTFYTLETGETFIRGQTSNAFANVLQKSTGTGATFSISGITEKEQLFLFPDMLRDKSTGNVLFMNEKISGKEANIGFVDSIAVGKRVNFQKLFSYTEEFNQVEMVDQLEVSNSNSFFQGSVSVQQNDTRIVGASTIFNLLFQTEDYIQIANGTAFDFCKITSVISNTEIYVQRPPRVYGSGLSYGKGLIIAQGETANANTSVITIFDTNNTTQTGNSTANLLIGQNSFCLAQANSIVTLGGTGYSNTLSSVTIANGTPTQAAQGVVVTNSTGGIVSINLTINGSGYDNDANVTLGGVGSGANLKVVMDYGYGFPKNPNGGLDDIIYDCLRANTYEIGTIIALSSINPGSNYNRKPFVAVVEPVIAGYNKQDYIISIENPTAGFQPGEQLTQQIPTNIIKLQYTNLTGNTQFDVAEQVYQGNINLPTARGVVVAQSSTDVSLGNVVGTFVNTTGVANQIHGITTSATANVANVQQDVFVTTARGVVLSTDVVNSSLTILTVDRRSFSSEFTVGQNVIGFSSTTQGNCIATAIDAQSKPLGLNANVEANVVTANGVATKLDIIDTGVGYENGYQVVLKTTQNNIFNITGFANCVYQGYGQGEFIQDRGKLNQAILHDNDRYQAFSYVIESSLSKEKYQDVVNKLLHIAGNRMFGDLNRQSEANASISIAQSFVQTA